MGLKMKLVLGLLLSAICSGSMLRLKSTTKEKENSPILIQTSVEGRSESSSDTHAHTQLTQTSGGGRACCVFEHDNYNGRAYCYLNQVSSYTGNEGFQDNISSVQVGGGCALTMWEHSGYSGSAVAYYGDVSYVGGGWNDRVSSLQCWCPVDCSVGSWSGWSACNVGCGGGSQSRSRGVYVWPERGGAGCPSLTEWQSCNTQPCPVDCQVSAWSDWAPCTGVNECWAGTSFTLGVGGGVNGPRARRTRTVTVAQVTTGKACPALQEIMTCNAPCNFCSPTDPNACTSCQVGYDLVGNSCVAQPPGPAVDLGCYNDQVSARDLPTYGGTVLTADPVKECAAKCKDVLSTPSVMYFGLQNSADCWCGINAPKYAQVAAGECNAKCKTNSAVMCGGVSKNSVYQVVNTQVCRFFSNANPLESTPSSFSIRGTYDSIEPAKLYGGTNNNQYYRIPTACTGTAYSSYFQKGTQITLTPGSSGSLNGMALGSATCSCTTCGERCADCKGGRPDACTRCNPLYKTDVHAEDGLVSCHPNPGPECCFYDRADHKGARVCVRGNSDWVGYDFQEKFRYAKIEEGCEASIFQYWKQNKGGWSVKLNQGDNSWVDKNPRSYSCNCGSTPTDTPPTPAPATWGKPIGDQATPTFEKLGCYRDNTNNVHDLSLHYTRRMAGPADPEGWCAQFCFDVGGDYFGLQNSDECWCGKTTPSQGQVAEGECNLKCRGNDAFVCGGLDRNSVYKITKAPQPELYKAAQQQSQAAAPSYENDAILAKGNLPILSDGKEDEGKLFTYLGCFYESDGLPDLYENAIESASMSPSQCLKNCNGFDIFGIREGLCVCGRSDWQPRWGHADESLCKVCVSDGGVKCGSNRQTSVYKLWV